MWQVFTRILPTGLFGATKGSFGVNHPFGLCGWSKVFRKGQTILQTLKAVEEMQRTSIERLLK